MIPFGEARETVLARCAPRGPAPVLLADVLGCVLAGPVVAPEAVPPWANSAMDGFAVRAADVAAAGPGSPVALPVVATVAAGAAAHVEVGPGQAVRIMTGAPMPPGADAVVMVERTRGGPDATVVEILEAVEPGRNVRLAGSDIPAGQQVLAGGTLLGPAHLGVLASVNVRRPVVVPRPSSGGHLHRRRAGRRRPSAGTRPDPREQPAHARGPGAELRVRRRGPGHRARRSRPAHHRPRRRRCLVRCGGHQRRREHGRLRPGQGGPGRAGRHALDAGGHPPGEAVRVGVLDGTPVFGLPGNPVSSLVSLALLGVPGLRRLAGRSDLDLPRVTVVAGPGPGGAAPTAEPPTSG